ncbi:hypothetical protein GCM10022240_08050 [Microbacterium kribbense]|uniref:ABM domain-containing protein n=1 Tax=Microbacterium kribbense TaxID=433645 RepID=A0ABP7G6J0_9MICO
MRQVFVVIVRIRARADRLDEFVAGLERNARATRTEPGCLRFDIVRERDAASSFILYEQYASADAFFTDHRQAAHYPAWQELCERCVVADGRHNTYGVTEVTDA